MKKLVPMLAAVMIALPAAAADKFHLYNWNNYIAPETVKRFEEFCKCEVVQTYYSDNEELLAKLAAGAKGYDILVPTSNVIQALIKGGQLKPIDKAQLPNLKNIDPAYLDTAFDPGNKYSVPYAMSLTVIGYNDQKIKELGLPTDTWAAVFDPKYLEKIKGRVTVLDSSSELFAAAGDNTEASSNEASTSTSLFMFFSGTGFRKVSAAISLSGEDWVRAWTQRRSAPASAASAGSRRH